MYHRIHPVFELSQARGEVVINVLLVNTGTVYVALSFRFVVNANTFCFMTIVVSNQKYGQHGSGLRRIFCNSGPNSFIARFMLSSIGAPF